MHDADFPYDVQWTDIDAMRSYLDFTYDPKNFEDLPKLVQELHAGGKHYVNIIDPGISSDEPAGTYPPFDDGMKKDIFIKNSNGTGIIIGKVNEKHENSSISIQIFSSIRLGLARQYSVSRFYKS